MAARSGLLVTQGKRKRYIYCETIQTIGSVLARLTRIISVGYLQCAGKLFASTNQSFPRFIACPFEAILREILSSQQGVLTKRDFISLELLTARGSIERASQCQTNGQLKLSRLEKDEVAQRRRKEKARGIVGFLHHHPS